MRLCNLYEAKTKLSQLVQAAMDGEEVVIARAGKPAVRLTPVTSPKDPARGWGALSADASAIDAAFTPAVDKQVAKLFLGAKKR